ncbi:MAG: hypothetical protein WCE43_07345, partial [Burkholderiales bacterium]
INTLEAGSDLDIKFISNQFRSIPVITLPLIIRAQNDTTQDVKISRCKAADYPLVRSLFQVL